MHVSTGVAFAIYFILWWLSLLIVLPWGTHSQEESGDVAPGTEPGAPAIHRVVEQADLGDGRGHGAVRGSCGRSTPRVSSRPT